MTTAHTVVDSQRVDAVGASAARTADSLLVDLGSSVRGLTDEEAVRRLGIYGPNAVSSHRARALTVLWHQVSSPLLVLLLAAATLSFFVGQRSDALIIAVIVAVSVGLGFGNEFRAEKAAQAMHSQIRNRAAVRRSGTSIQIDVRDLVPGDIVDLRVGDIVPADLRLLAVSDLECDEAVMTGESLPVPKDVAPTAPGAALAELTSCALMGTIVHAGSGTGIVVSTGARTRFGAIAAGLNTHPMETEFQAGLRKFSMLLVYVAAALTGSIFVANVILHKPVIDAFLFSLAIAVGITPQLLPAVVSTSLAAGSRRMRQRKVLVKRLVCIEDLGDIDVLFTDKTGTLTEGRIGFLRAIAADRSTTTDVLRWGLICSGSGTGDVPSAPAAGGSPLDEALWRSARDDELRASIGEHRILQVLPFDHRRQMVTAAVSDPVGAVTIVSTGAPEAILARCATVPAGLQQQLDSEFAAGNRVVAVAAKLATGPVALSTDDERDLIPVGLLVFLDAPRADAAPALSRLTQLGITVKVITGDNPVVALKVCQELGLAGGQAVTGAELDTLDDDALLAVLPVTTVFARVSPEQKARIVHLEHQSGHGVAFLGDGVNDTLALHAADVGISVDSATDVAKDASDVILLEKDLGVLADGVAEGRRIFANTIKYVLMGTSSNFGNMFSAAIGSLFLPFLPMLPSQILLNNLLYDTGQLTIPSDRVDSEQLLKPSHWDISYIRKFMVIFGPISSLFDLATFGILIWVLHAGAPEFHSGWFVESLATQSLVIFAIRTRRSPFIRSRPGLSLTISVLAAVAVGAVLPQIRPVADALGFRPLPIEFWAALGVMVIAYLGLIEVVKWQFYRQVTASPRSFATPDAPLRRRQRRRAGHFSTDGRDPGPSTLGRTSPRTHP